MSPFSKATIPASIQQTAIAQVTSVDWGYENWCRPSGLRAAKGLHRGAKERQLCGESPESGSGSATVRVLITVNCSMSVFPHHTHNTKDLGKIILEIPSNFSTAIARVITAASMIYYMLATC